MELITPFYDVMNRYVLNPTKHLTLIRPIQDRKKPTHRPSIFSKHPKNDPSSVRSYLRVGQIPSHKLSTLRMHFSGDYIKAASPNLNTASWTLRKTVTRPMWICFKSQWGIWVQSALMLVVSRCRISVTPLSVIALFLGGII